MEEAVFKDVLMDAGCGNSPKDELTDILSEHINLDTMVNAESGLPNMDCKDVEDIFKGVLTDESQESADSTYPAHPTPSPALGVNNAYVSHPVGPGPAMVRALSATQGTSSPSALPPHSPYLSEYSNSPGFSPAAFSEPPASPWLSGSGPGSGGGVDHDAVGGVGVGDGVPTVNQRNALKWEADESLGLGATISAVLYANTNHPNLKRDFPGASLAFVLFINLS